MNFLENAHIVNGLYPVADAAATSATTDYVSLENYRKVGFLIHTGVVNTADGVVTVLGATAAAGTNATAVPFTYRTCASSTTVDTWGAVTAATASGFAMTATDNYMYWVEVDVDDIVANDTDAIFAALKITEDTNDPALLGVATFLLEPRYPQAVPVSAIA